MSTNDLGNTLNHGYGNTTNKTYVGTTAATVCPTCHHCPTCGRSTNYFPQWQYPVPQWTATGTTGVPLSTTANSTIK